MKKQHRFLIVDDDPFCNSICKYFIKKNIAGAEVIEFHFPKEGIEYIESFYNDIEIDCPTILFLDINMPEMSGWEFLERFNILRDHIKKQFAICILTSSVSSTDRERALSNHNINGYLNKPLTHKMIDEILADIS